MLRCRRKKLAIGQVTQQPWRSQVTPVAESRAGGTVLQGSTASPRLSSFGQGQVCGVQLLCLLADVLLHYVALS